LSSTLRHAWRSQRGQAVTETLMVSWILIVFIAAAHQVFLVNETIFRSITAVHQDLFTTAYKHNCASSREECTYDGGDLKAKSIWTPEAIPEIEITRVGMFRRYGMPGNLRLTSNSPLNIGSLNCPDCKRTKLGAGTYQNPFTTVARAAAEMGGIGGGFSTGGLFGGIGGLLGNGMLGNIGSILNGPMITGALQNSINNLMNGFAGPGGPQGMLNNLMQQAQTSGLEFPR
jgi:hypothetical protein